ncbi:MAG TPA: hypothetical protein PLE74_07150 [Candidatus Cloacimonadota bacterium]|nr:hypothetical protein [Candidatus Cloacimonadota bacterium]HPT72042.1 hypothetical protein [Candidatus Cloacimonadota bacterium]
MKPKFNHSHKGFSGKVDGLLYKMYNEDQLCYASKFIKPSPNSQTALMRAIGSNLGNIFSAAQASYIADMKAYSKKYKHLIDQEKQIAPSAQALFVKMLWAWRKTDPVQNDLSVLTLEDIIDKNIPCKSVKEAIDAHYLPKVTGYQAFTHLIA